mmetsp:Transcript_43895/g.52637  ORF Transcript_43895/g.52637 Transcript_43895/m.52637 type:complete len:215 (+) Transcript_43895:245-889(+)
MRVREDANRVERSLRLWSSNNSLVIASVSGVILLRRFCSFLHGSLEKRATMLRKYSRWVSWARYCIMFHPLTTVGTTTSPSPSSSVSSSMECSSSSGVSGVRGWYWIPPKLSAVRNNKWFQYLVGRSSTRPKPLPSSIPRFRIVAIMNSIYSRASPNDVLLVARMTVWKLALTMVAPNPCNSPTSFKNVDRRSDCKTRWRAGSCRWALVSHTSR